MGLSLHLKGGTVPRVAKELVMEGGQAGGGEVVGLVWAGCVPTGAPDQPLEPLLCCPVVRVKRAHRCTLRPQGLDSSTMQGFLRMGVSEGILRMRRALRLSEALNQRLSQHAPAVGKGEHQQLSRH